MSYALINVNSINENDLTVPTSTINTGYKLGTIYQFADSDAPNAVKAFMYIKANGALTAYQPYRVLPSGTAGAEWTTGAIITLADSSTLIGLPQVAFTSGYYGFIQVSGVATYLTGSQAITDGASLKVINAGTTLITDSSGGTQSANSCAWSIGGATISDTTSSCMLMGARVAVAAS